MDEVARHAAGEELCPPRSFAITFDDGFRNNLTVAAPILRELGIPAAIYVTTDFIDNDALSWVDRIEAAVEHTPLQSIRGPWPVSDLYPLSDTRQRIAFMSEVRRVAKVDPSIDLDAFADELVELLLGGSTITREDILDSKLSWHEVRKLATDDLFTIGGHGMTHRILGFLSEEESTVEIDQSLTRLRDEVAPATLHYSYPEGFPGSYTEREALRLADWKSATAVTTTPGYVSPGDAALELNRFFIA
jgi:peptidoglycan/xylan/chitin deacetylase (PgdA/CDA1 family)